MWGPLKGYLNVGLMVFVMACVGALLVLAAGRWVAVARGLVPVRPEAPGGAVPLPRAKAVE